MNNNVKKITLDAKVYNLEVVLNASYAFIDRAYIFLDTGSQGERIKVYIKGKDKLSERQFERIKGEFMNELLDCALRYEISKNNKKIREYIVGRALYSALPSLDLAVSNEKINYQEDPLGIAKSWEKKYGKKKNAKKHKV